MMKKIGELLMEMHKDLGQSHRLPGSNGLQIRAATRAADHTLGSAICATPDIERARARFHDAVEIACNLGPEQNLLEPAQCREKYRRALAALHAYSVTLDEAKPSLLGSKTHDMSSVMNPVPIAPEPV